jgi:hypothetical protein
VILLQIDRERIASIELENDPPRPIHGHRVAHWIRARERIGPESKVARRAQLCAYLWVQGSPLAPAAQAIILFNRGEIGE